MRCNRISGKKIFGLTCFVIQRGLMPLTLYSKLNSFQVDFVLEPRVTWLTRMFDNSKIFKYYSSYLIVRIKNKNTYMDFIGIFKRKKYFCLNSFWLHIKESLLNYVYWLEKHEKYTPCFLIGELRFSYAKITIVKLYKYLYCAGIDIVVSGPREITFQNSKKTHYPIVARY